MDNNNSDQSNNQQQYNQQYNQQYGQQPYGQQPYGQQYNEPYIPEEYTPISMWGYFGYQLLFSIPCVGLILLIVFSFGGTKNINLRNFARSYFCFVILSVAIFFILLACGGIAALTALSTTNF